MYERLLNIFAAVGSPKVLVVGDFMLDNYLYGNTDRISPEAPVIVMNVTDRHEQPGGAGSVASDLAILQAEVRCLGVVGKDYKGPCLRGMLGDLAGVDVEGLISVDDRPTTSKQRVIGLAQHRHRQQLMRIDEECSGAIAAEAQARLSEKLEESIEWCDVVCLEDYNKGVLCESFCQKVIATAKAHGKRTIVDPAAITDYGRYRGAWLIKPNRRELGLATGIVVDGESTWQQACKQLAQSCDISNVAVTLDKLGAYLYELTGGEDGQGSGELIATRARNVYDVTGAGDMVLAMLGLLVAGKYEDIEAPSLREVVQLANTAGGLEVERFGCVGITRDEIIAELVHEQRGEVGKLRSPEALLAELAWHRQQDLKIVFTNGCFDILHPGHIKLLSFAKEQGDVLVVAINSDNSVRRLKGAGRPILKEQDRAALLAALEAVDYVVVFDEPDPQQLIEKISPDILLKGADWSGAVVGQQWVEEHGGKVVLMPLSKGQSTTNIIERVIEQNCKLMPKREQGS